MRIDLYSSSASQISSETGSQKASAQSGAASTVTSGEDRATLTSGSASVASLVSTALTSPEIRQDKVDSLRQAVSSGQYELDPDKIAESILNQNA